MEQRSLPSRSLKHPASPLPQGWGYRIPLAILSGVLLSAGFLADALFFTAWFALVPLLLALEGVKQQRMAMGLGLITGLVTHLLGFYWLVDTMVRFGGIPYPISLLLFLLIATAFGFIHLLFALGYCWGHRRVPAGSLRQALFIATLYTALEFLYPHVFPWRLGNTQIAWLPLVQIADVTGVYGITFLVVLVNALLFQGVVSLREKPVPFPWRSMVVTGLLLGLTIGYGYRRLDQVQRAVDSAPRLRVALLQPNIDVKMKYDQRFAEEQLLILALLSRQVIAEGAELVVWPETAYRYWVYADAQSIPLPLAPPPNVHLLIGANTFNPKAPVVEKFNSALLLDAEGKVLGRYDKHRLLMFGEYVPFARYFPFLQGISPAIGDFTPGYGEVTLQLPGGLTLAPLICYEDIFPSLAREAVQKGAQVLVNLTNDAWFGPTRAPYQHQLLARFRAIETRRPLIRATNTGVTSVIDPSGTLVAEAKIYIKAAIVQDIPLLKTETIYTRWGDAFALLTVLGTATWIWPKRPGGELA
ncbi:MAG: apolipoprotein N-acyltransferase [Nitrospinota bacterium]|nr:MAG: apolipoprotein N-acyltransferase [Nitrospinota bacterium]